MTAAARFRTPRQNLHRLQILHRDSKLRNPAIAKVAFFVGRAGMSVSCQLVLNDELIYKSQKSSRCCS